MKIVTSALLLALLAWLAWFDYSGGFGPPEWPAQEGGSGPFAAITVLIALALLLVSLFAGIALAVLAGLLLGTSALLWNIAPLFLPLLALVWLAWLVVTAYRRRHVEGEQGAGLRT